MKEKDFKKYSKQGSDYHYKLVNKWNIFRFDPFLYAKYKKCIDILEEYVREYEGKNTTVKILDMGCGDGVFFYLLKFGIRNINIEFTGVDSSFQAIETAQKKNPEASFFVGNVYSLNEFEDDHFDIVLSTDVIEHLTYPKTMIQEARRVCKSNGLMVMGTPIRLSEYPQDEFHCHEFFEEEFLNLVNRYFRVHTLKKSHPLILFLLQRKKVNLVKKIPLFRYIFAIFSLLGVNPYLFPTREEGFYCYMYIIARNG